MTLLERIGEAIGGGYSVNKKRLLIDLYHEAYPQKTKLDYGCSACGTDAFNKLTYLYNKENFIPMAKTKYKIKGLVDGQYKVYPKLGLSVSNETITDAHVALLKRAGLESEIEEVKGAEKNI